MNVERKNELDTIFIQSFGVYRQIQILRNPKCIINEEFINTFIDVTTAQYDCNVDTIEREYVANTIKSIYSIYQEEGAAILGDYGHDYEWYKKVLNDSSFKQYYWTRYRNYLIENKGFATNIVDDKLDKETLFNLMSYIGNPNEEAHYSIRGLVVGDVQSGKTSNYLGLITKAADSGYKVIFLLTGTIESLRKQTQIRVEEGFVGYDTVNACDVGVGRGEKTPKAFTSRDKDFTGKDDQNTTYRISDYSSEPMIFVIKKNVSVLKKLYASLKNINTNQYITQITAPMLMIDDEADNASINTNKLDDDPTQINKYIRQILALFSHNSYVGFTATPFANVFISYDSEDDMLKDDLFPRNFIYALESPSNYCGAKNYFYEKNPNVRFITDSNEQLFPIIHKKTWNGDRLFDSLYTAINSFLIVNAIRDLRDINKNTHRSMLINMSRFTDVQIKIKEIVEGYFNNLIRNIKQNHKLSYDEYMQNHYVKGLYTTFTNEYSNILLKEKYGKIVEWKDIFSTIYDSCRNIEVVVVNSSKHSTKLNYDDHKSTGLRVIAIGGLALSRGLTLEGLCVSYFFRNTATFDVLMQMGRWFGYRDGYRDLCKIYLLRDSFDYYTEISESIEQLKKDIHDMSASNKRPEDYGIRVRNNSDELGITAPNKSRSVKTKKIYKSYAGTLFETPYIHCNSNIVNSNVEVTKTFINNIKSFQGNVFTKKPYFCNVDTSYIIDLLNKIKVHEANANFDTKQLISFLKNNNLKYPYFDVLLMEGSEEKREIINNINISLVKRNYDIVNNNTLIRISAQRAHLWGTRDTQEGIDPNKLEKFGDLATRKSVTAKEFMNKELRSNPLFIIYFIKPITANEMHISKLEQEFRDSKYDYLVGYVIGFPESENLYSKDGLIEDNETKYYVNTTCNYYDKQHDEDIEMYGEE